MDKQQTARAVERALSKNIRERIGKGPRLIKAVVYENSIDIEVIGYLTKMETNYLEIAGVDGHALVKSNRLKMLEATRESIIAELSEAIKLNVHIDHIDMRVNEDYCIAKLIFD